MVRVCPGAKNNVCSLVMRGARDCPISKCALVGNIIITNSASKSTSPRSSVTRVGSIKPSPNTPEYSIPPRVCIGSSVSIRRLQRLTENPRIVRSTVAASPPLPAPRIATLGIWFSAKSLDLSDCLNFNLFGIFRSSCHRSQHRVLVCLEQ